MSLDMEALSVLHVIWRRLPGGVSHRLRQADDAVRGGREIADRLQRIFLRDETGRRPVFGGTEKFQKDPGKASSQGTGPSNVVTGDRPHRRDRLVMKLKVHAGPAGE
jgi:hypothetical protein